MRNLISLLFIIFITCSISGRSYYAKFTSVQGYRGSTDNFYPNPWRAINSNGTDSILFNISTEGASLRNSSIIRNDKGYIFSTSITTEFDYWNSSTTFDALTGETISSTSTWEVYDGSKSLKGIAYDVKEKVYYVLTYKYADNYFDCSLPETYLQKYDPKTNELTYITTMQLLWQNPLAIAYNPLDGEMYVTNQHGEIGILNKSTGFVNKIVQLPVTESNVYNVEHSMIYSIEDKAFVVSYVIYTDLQSNEGGLMLVNPQSKTYTQLTTYKNRHNGFYSWIANPDVYATALSPKKPVVYINYPQASTTGSIDITIPSKTINETDLSGEVYTKINVDSVQTIIKSSPGEEIRAPFSLEPGIHRLAIKTYQVINSDTIHGVGAHCLFYVGYDTPKAPKNVTLNNTSIKWDKVDNIGANNGYVDIDNVKYNVYLNDTKLNEEPISDTQYNINIDVTENQIIYQAHVEAVFDTVKSSKSGSNKIYVGECYSLPTYPNLLDFASSSTNGTVIIINQDNDSYHWEWDNDGRGYEYKCHTGQSWNGTANDWFVLPKMRFDKPLSFYEINIFAFLNYGIGGKYEICFSPTLNPEDIEFKKTMTTKYDFHNRQEESIKIFIPEAKDYYIMFHPVESELDNIYIQGIILDYAKNIVELEGEYSFRSRTSKLNWKHNLYADNIITIKGYNVYRDGELLAQVDNATTSYNDQLSKEETEIYHEYSVAVRYEYEGIEYQTDLSNAFIASYSYGSVEDVENNDVSIYSTANKIIIKGAPIGSKASIASIEGKLIHAGSIESDLEEFNTGKGVYLITINGNTTKIIVN